MGFKRREKAPEVRLRCYITGDTAAGQSTRAARPQVSFACRSDAFPKPYCSAAVPAPSLNPTAHPELQPPWVQAHKPSLSLIATNHHLCALMSEDLWQRSAPGIHTAVKNKSAICTLVTQTQQQFCCSGIPEKCLPRTEPHNRWQKEGVFLHCASRFGWSSRKILC